jgi:hypothetical protein
MCNTCLSNQKYEGVKLLKQVCAVCSKKLQMAKKMAFFTTLICLKQWGVYLPKDLRKVLFKQLASTKNWRGVLEDERGREREEPERKKKKI